MVEIGKNVPSPSPKHCPSALYFSQLLFGAFLSPHKGLAGIPHLGKIPEMAGIGKITKYYFPSSRAEVCSSPTTFEISFLCTVVDFDYLDMLGNFDEEFSSPLEFITSSQE